MVAHDVEVLRGDEAILQELRQRSLAVERVAASEADHAGVAVDPLVRGLGILGVHLGEVRSLVAVFVGVILRIGALVVLHAVAAAKHAPDEASGGAHSADYCLHGPHCTLRFDFLCLAKQFARGARV